MAHISGFARDQLLLLPEAVDDYVDAENPVRFIDAVVDGLGLTAAGFARIRGKVLIPEEAAPQFLDDAAPRNGMMPPPDSEMIAPPITE